MVPWNSQPVWIKSIDEALQSNAVIWKTVFLRLKLITKPAKKKLLTIVHAFVFAVADQFHLKWNL